MAQPSVDPYTTITAMPETHAACSSRTKGKPSPSSLNTSDFCQDCAFFAKWAPTVDTDPKTYLSGFPSDLSPALEDIPQWMSDEVLYYSTQKCPNVLTMSTKELHLIPGLQQ
jgi:hypothetical protein